MFAAAGCLLAGALLLNPAGVLAQHSVVGGKPAATGKAAAAHVMALEEKYADMGTAIKLVKNGDKDLSAYLSDPDNECTVFLPTSQAGCSCSMRQLCVWCGGQCVCVTDLFGGSINSSTGVAFQPKCNSREPLVELVPCR